MKGKGINQLGFQFSTLQAIITTITFGFAMFAIPISGTLAPENALEYPFLDTLSQVPRDYMWMALAIIMLILYLVVCHIIHAVAEDDRKIFSQLGLTFAILATGTLIVNYFLQYSIVPSSLYYGETDGISLLTMYNPRGVFIALEEVGCLMMSISFVFTAQVFNKKNTLEKAIKYIFQMAFVLGILSYFAIWILMGLKQLELFEIIIISINWLVLIINGILLAKWFKRKSLTENY